MVMFSAFGEVYLSDMIYRFCAIVCSYILKALGCFSVYYWKVGGICLSPMILENFLLLKG